MWGLENGYALMYGGDAENVAKVQPVFDALKPEGDFGAVHAGKVGAGHFAKMVHNGIEYAMMQAYAEGWELLEKVDSVTDVREVFRSWQEGTVIRSWLLDLAVNALDDDEHLDQLRGYAQDSGEGRWTVEAAIDNAVPLPAITASLFARFASRQDDSPQMKMIAALRNQFGGHAVENEVAAATAVAQAVGRSANDHARHASVAGRLPLVRPGRGSPRPGRHRLRRPQRPGQDQSGRGGRLSGHPRQPPGLLRRAAGAHGRRARRRSGPRSRQGERQQLIELELNPGQANRARINRSSQVRPRDVLGIVRTVLFAPEDLALVKGDPGERRRFLDELITARSPRMAGVRSDYDRVLKQRNTLLKSAALARRHGGRSMDLSTLDVWDQHLARAGAELLAQRLDLIADAAAAGGQGVRAAGARAAAPSPWSTSRRRRGDRRTRARSCTSS